MGCPMIEVPALAARRTASYEGYNSQPITCRWNLRIADNGARIDLRLPLVPPDVLGRFRHASEAFRAGFRPIIQ